MNFMCAVIYLCRTVKLSVSNTIIINFELIHAVHIWNLESSLIPAVTSVIQCGAYKWIDTDKFQLDIVGNKWLPLAIAQFFNGNGVNGWIGDGIVLWCFGFASNMMFNLYDTNATNFTEYPFSNSAGHLMVTGLGMGLTAWSRYRRCECFVREEEQWSYAKKERVIRIEWSHSQKWQ